MIIEVVPVGSMEVNCYIIANKQNGQAIIIDPGDDTQKIKAVLKKHKLYAGAIINTHGHIDHIGSDDDFGVEVFAHEKELPLLLDSKLNLSDFLGAPYKVKAKLRPLKDAESFELDGISLEVIHTPGHTPGGICLLLKKPDGSIIFSGDTLFSQGVGRTDFPGSSTQQLFNSIKNKLFILPEETLLYPGHGPSSTIGREKRNNY